MKHSIKTQLVLSFAGLIAVILGAFLLINNLFLEKFYFREKEEDLEEIYTEINSVEQITDYQSEKFERDFRKISGANNVDLLILGIDSDDGSVWILYQSRDNAVMRGRIEGYLLGLNSSEDNKDILLRTDNYLIRSSVIPRKIPIIWKRGVPCRRAVSS